NYPYLSVETSVSPETVAVNGTIDTTIRLRGDGWALQPDPIDVMLVIDRSGSMSGDSPTRISCAKAAAKTFVARMDPAKDQIGVVSYSSGSTLDLSLTYDHSMVNGIIDGLNANGYTATRKALYTSIQEMIANPNPDPDAVQAIILMTDGEFNYYGDPLARGRGHDSNHRDFDDRWYKDQKWNSVRTDRYTFFSGLGGTYDQDGGLFTEQNMSIYASNNNIRLYTISFSDNISDGSTTWNTLETLAEATGGKHYHAEGGEELTQVYTEIAGELKVEAGVNTTMHVCFQSVEVNGTSVSGDDVFDYVYVPEISTRIYSSYNGTDIMGYHDDTPNWTASRTLHFDIGTVRLNQVWETTFRLQVLADGNINVFGSGSTITFNDGADALNLPDLFVTAIPGLTNTGVETGTLDVANLRCTGSGPYLDFLPLAWDLTYTGADEVTEDIYCQNDGVSWIYVASKTPEMAGGTAVTENCLLDVRHLPPGTYTIRVRATAPDAPADQETLDVADWVGRGERPYIRIQ
ncbi:VWA domain-containing protein, partial [Methanoculleus sp. FWC-SCC1]